MLFCFSLILFLYYHWFLCKLYIIRNCETYPSKDLNFIKTNNIWIIIALYNYQTPHIIFATGVVLELRNFFRTIRR